MRSRTRNWFESLAEEDFEALFVRKIDIEALMTREPELAPNAIAPELTRVLRARTGEEHFRYGLAGHTYQHFGSIITVAAELGYG